MFVNILTAHDKYSLLNRDISSNSIACTVINKYGRGGEVQI